MKTEKVKDLNYWKANAEEDYLHVPISVLRYITELERELKESKKHQQKSSGTVEQNHKSKFNVTYLANDEIIKSLVVLANNKKEAMNKALELRSARDVYSVIKTP